LDWENKGTNKWTTTKFSKIFHLDYSCPQGQQQLSGTHNVPIKHIQSALQSSSHTTLTQSLTAAYYCPHLIDKKTDSMRQNNLLQVTRVVQTEPELKPKMLDSSTAMDMTEVK